MRCQAPTMPSVVIRCRDILRRTSQVLKPAESGVHREGTKVGTKRVIFLAVFGFLFLCIISFCYSLFRCKNIIYLSIYSANYFQLLHFLPQ